MQTAKKKTRGGRGGKGGRARPQSLKRRMPLGDSAYGIIKEAIVNCEINPGQEVTQSELIGRYSLTNAQARHALVRLTQEGWVRPLPQRGYLIAPLTMKDLEDVWEMRLLIEPLAMRKAAGRIDPEVRKYLEKIGDAEYIAGNPESIRKFLRGHRDFYTTVARCCGNKMMARAVDQLFDSSNRLLYFTMLHAYEAQTVRRNHQKLVEALVEGNGKEAERLRRTGLERGRQVIRDVLLSMPSIMDANLVNKAEPG